MNSSLSKLLRPSSHSILKTFSKMMTTQTTQFLISTTSVSEEKHRNFPMCRCPIDDFLMSYFLSDSDDFFYVPIFHESAFLVNSLVIHYGKPFQTIIPKLQSISYFDSNTNSKTFLLLLRLLSHADQHNLLIDTYRYFVECHEYIPNTFASNLLMDSLFTTGQSQSAFSVFKQINSPYFFTFDIAIFHLSDIANISHVLTHMLRMPYYPSHDTFNKLLCSFCKMNAMPQVNQLLGLMVVKLGFEISVNAWAVLVTKFVRLSSLNQIDAMISQGFVVPDEDEGSSDMQIHDTFYDLLYSVCVMKAMPQACQIFGLIVNNLGIEISVNVWTSLVTKLIVRGHLAGPLKNVMLSDSFMPDKGRFLAQINAVCDEVRTSVASGVFEVVDNHGYQGCPLFYFKYLLVQKYGDTADDHEYQGSPAAADSRWNSATEIVKYGDTNKPFGALP